MKVVNDGYQSEELIMEKIMNAVRGGGIIHKEDTFFPCFSYITDDITEAGLFIIQLIL